METEIILIMLTALTAFFTLVTGAFAIFATFAIFYLKKLASDKQGEIKKLTELRLKFEEKLSEMDEKTQSIGEAKDTVAGLKVEYKRELGDLRQSYRNLLNQLYRAFGTATTYNIPLVTSPDEPSLGSPTMAELQKQIAVLLTQIQQLQEQLGQRPTIK